MSEHDFCLSSKHTFLSEVKYARFMRRYLFFFTLDMGFSHEEARCIEASFYEAIQNVIQHAKHISQKLIITTEFRNFQSYLEIYIKDSGIQVPRSKILARPLDEYRTSGLGLYFMENVMDYLNYDTSNQHGTILTMVKQLQ